MPLTHVSYLYLRLLILTSKHWFMCVIGLHVLLIHQTALIQYQIDNVYDENEAFALRNIVR